MQRERFVHLFQRAVAGALLCSALCMVGCQVDVAGQTLPSPYYIYDDIQYFPAGPEFQLTEEAETMKIYAADEELGQ